MEPTQIRGRPKESLIKRFLKHIEIAANDCWQWTGAISKYGYACFLYPNGGRASRFSFEYFKGDIPSGFTIDHLCRNRACVNPDHLEAVTSRENILRGESCSAQNAIKVQCPKGHPYNDLNTTYSKGRRYCRICNREKLKRLRLERKVDNEQRAFK